MKERTSPPFRCLRGLALGMLLSWNTLAAEGVPPAQRTAQHWIAQDLLATKPRLSPAQIEVLNAAIAAADLGVVALEHHPESLDRATLLSRLEEFQPRPEPYGDGRGQAVSAHARQTTLAARALSAVRDRNPVRWGLLPARANVRLLPTDQGWFDSLDDHDFDQLQNSALFAYEPVAILHTSQDGQWLFVQASYVRGWIRRTAICEVASKAEALRWQRGPFVTVLAPRLEVGGRRFEMGTRLPLAGTPAGQEAVWVFAKGAWQTATLPAGAETCRGALPFTTGNLLRQAFKLLGESYDWGGREGRHDCSSFIQAVYRTMGVDLPRNSGDQAHIPGGHRIAFATGAPAAQRIAQLKTLRPGAILRLKGHVMLYLGDDGSGPRILHDFSSHAQLRPDGSLEVFRVMQVDVTPLSLRRKSGDTFLEVLTHAWEPTAQP